VLRAFVFGASFASFLAFAVQAEPVVISGSDTLAGTSYSTSEIATQATPINTITYGGYTGVTLWSFLGGSDTTTTSGGVKYYGAIATAPQTNGNPNSIIRYYVTATGSSGAQSVVSLGSIDPTFVGSSATAPFIAYQTAGGTPLATPVLVVPNSPPGASVQNLTSLNVSTVASPASRGGGQSSSVALSGKVTSPGTHSTFPGSFAATSLTLGGTTYTGIPLATFLNVPSDVDPNTLLVVATGTDGYQVVYSYNEFLNADGSVDLTDLLAYASTGTDFPASGIARTILGSDNAFRHGRWMSNLVSLDVISVAPVPLPASLSLFVAALGAFAAFGWHQKRKAEADV